MLYEILLILLMDDIIIVKYFIFSYIFIFCFELFDMIKKILIENDIKRRLLIQLSGYLVHCGGFKIFTISWNILNDIVLYYPKTGRQFVLF